MIVFILPTGTALAAPTVPSLNITTGTLSKLLTGVSDYYCAVSATGGAEPYAWSASGLPSGLNIEAIGGTLSGKIFGTPPSAGTYTVTVTVSDSHGESASRTLTLTVIDPGSLSHTSTATTSTSASTQEIASGTAGTAYSAYIGPGMTADQIPPGLSYDPSSGVLSGTPAASGSYHIGSRATVTVSTTVMSILIGSFLIGYNMVADTCTITNDMTMAVTGAVFTVRFDSQSGSAVADIGSVQYGDKLGEPAAPTRAGYAFAGWYREPSCVSAWNFESDIVTGDTTLYARWIQDGSVSISCLTTDVALYGASTGSITVSAAGGSGTFRYSIDNGATWQSSESFAGLAAGSYTAVACDAANPENRASSLLNVGQPRLAWKGTANKMPAKAAAGTAWVVRPVSAPKGYKLASVTFSSGSKAVAAIDSSGNATFLRGGKVKFTVTAIFKKGNTTKIIKSIKQVTVTQLVKAVTLNQTSVDLKQKSKLKLTVTINPASATSKKVSWKSSNTKVAVVSSSGVVTAKGKGAAVITCTAQDGSKAKAICTVLVS